MKILAYLYNIKISVWTSIFPSFDLRCVAILIYLTNNSKENAKAAYIVGIEKELEKDVTLLGPGNYIAGADVSSLWIVLLMA